MNEISNLKTGAYINLFLAALILVGSLLINFGLFIVMLFVFCMIIYLQFVITILILKNKGE